MSTHPSLRLRRVASSAALGVACWLDGAGVGSLLAAEHARPVRAGPAETGGVHLVLTAPRGCANESTLKARVLARAENLRFTSRKAARYFVHARVVPRKGGRYVAELDVATRGAAHTSRSVSAETCALAFDALVVILAVTLDHTGAIETPHGADASSADAAAGTASNQDAERGDRARSRGAEHEAGADVRGEPRNEVRDDASAPLRDETSDGAADSVPPGKRPRFELGLEGSAFWGPAPDPLVGGTLAAGVELGAASALRPWLGVTLGYGRRGGIEATGGRATFELYEASLLACPVALSSSGLSARPCAWAMAGALAATGADTIAPRSSQRPFAVLGGTAQLELAASRHWLAVARFRMGANLIRDEYEFAPESFHRTASVSYGVGLGMHYRF